MSDARYRQIERQYLASGDPEAFNALITEGIRSGNRSGVERIIAGLFTPYDVPFKTDPPHCSSSPVNFQVPMLNREKRRSVCLFQLGDSGLLESARHFYNVNSFQEHTSIIAPPKNPASLLKFFPKRLVYDMETLVGAINVAISDHNQEENLQFSDIEVTGSRQCGRFMTMEDAYSVGPQCYLWNIQMRRRIDQIRLTLTLTRSPFGDNLEMAVETTLRYFGHAFGDYGEVQGLRISGERYQNWGFGFDGDVDDEEYQDYENADTWDWFNSLEQAQQLIDEYFEELENII